MTKDISQNQNSSLITPRMMEQDGVFPGENWFLYWKTASSLWESKLRMAGGQKKIFVPINWSFHSETGDQFDFGQRRPETELAKLVSLADELHKQLVFLLPFGPVPIMPNGGLPSVLAREMTEDEEGLAQVFVNSEGKLVKFYSYYDTKIFQAFSKFVRELSFYFEKEGISNEVWGIESGYLDDNNFHSYLKEYGPGFLASFKKFLEIKRAEGNESNNPFEKLDEKSTTVEFEQTISDLYRTSIKENFDSQCEGFLKVCFLGGKKRDVFDRFSGEDLDYQYVGQVLESVSLGLFPSSSLLPINVKNGLVNRLLNSLSDNYYFDELSSPEILEDEGVGSLKPLSFFHLYDSGSNSKADWHQNGLYEFIQSEYKWNFLCKFNEGNEIDEVPMKDQLVNFFHSHEMTNSRLHSILKLFLNGGKCVLDSSELNEDLSRRIETFIIENNLELEEVNFNTLIRHVSIGNGKLVIFDGTDISKLDSEKRNTFWSKLVSYFELFHLKILGGDGTEWIWWTRNPNTSELNFEEVRRLTIMNPSSYKKKIRIPLGKNFVLMRFVDQHNSDAKSSHSELEIQMLPNGNISIDFGLFGTTE